MNDCDPELAEAIRAIQAQELGHLEFASSRLGPLRAGDRLLTAMVGHVTEALIWLSTQGDSARLARQLNSPVEP